METNNSNNSKKKIIIWVVILILILWSASWAYFTMSNNVAPKLKHKMVSKKDKIQVSNKKIDIKKETNNLEDTANKETKNLEDTANKEEAKLKGLLDNIPKDDTTEDVIQKDETPIEQTNPTSETEAKVIPKIKTIEVWEDGKIVVDEQFINILSKWVKSLNAEGLSFLGIEDGSEIQKLVNSNLENGTNDFINKDIISVPYTVKIDKDYKITSFKVNWKDVKNSPVIGMSIFEIDDLYKNNNKTQKFNNTVESPNPTIDSNKTDTISNNLPQDITAKETIVK